MRRIKKVDISKFIGYEPQLIAHRGAPEDAPENTMASFEKALEMSCHYIELDVQMSKDGKLVILHDPMVDRTTDGKGAVGQFTWDALRRLDAGSWFHHSFAMERIPSLEEVMQRYSDQVGLLIEVKHPSLYPGIERRLGEVLEDVTQAGRQSKVIVQSFDAYSVERFHQMFPDIPVGVLIQKKGELTNGKLAYFSSFSNYVNLHKKLVRPKTVDRIHQFGCRVMAWTLSKSENAYPLFHAGVDGIITNDLQNRMWGLPPY